MIYCPNYVNFIKLERKYTFWKFHFRKCKKTLTLYENTITLGTYFLLVYVAVKLFLSYAYDQIGINDSWVSELIMVNYLQRSRQLPNV